MNPPSPQPDPRLTQQTAVGILVQLQLAYKIATIYKTNNLIFRRHLNLLFNMIEASLKREGEAFFQLRQRTLFFNRIRTRFRFSNFRVFKFVLTIFQAKEIGTMSFEPGLTEEDLARFIVLLAKSEKKTGAVFEDLVRELEEGGVRHIALVKISPYEIPSEERDAAKVYFLGIAHLKEHFDQGNKEKIKINTTRRLMQSFFNHIVENESFIYGLTNLKNHDEYTLNHSVNVCTLSIALGRRLGLDRDELVELGLSAFFHDIGKLGTPLEILNKPAKLTDDEREVMEKHVHLGAEMLIQGSEYKNIPLRAIHVALEHHIRADLSGYPRPFKRTSVNLFSRIVKIVDYFDAITTPRVYRKKAFTRQEALVLMREQSGKEFDPMIFKVFSRMMGAYPVGTLVLLNTGELGIVFGGNPEAAFGLRPEVKLISDAAGNKIDGDIVDLGEMDPVSGRYRKKIVKPLDPEKYGISIPDYFLAQAQ